MSKKHNDAFYFVLENYKEFVNINKLLLVAVKQSNVYFVQRLKESGADIGAVTKYAYMVGNHEILKLIDHENNNFKPLNEVNKKIYNYGKIKITQIAPIQDNGKIVVTSGSLPNTPNVNDNKINDDKKDNVINQTRIDTDPEVKEACKILFPPK